MRRRSSGTRNVYEFGRATVIVKADSNSIIDGLLRSTFKCEVHPVKGEVYSCDVRAFYAWQAANVAILNWQEATDEK